MRRAEGPFARVQRHSFLTPPAHRQPVQAAMGHPHITREERARLSSNFGFRGIRRKVSNSATTTLVIGLALGGLGLGGLGLGVVVGLGGQSATAAPSSPTALVCGNSSDLSGP